MHEGVHACAHTHKRDKRTENLTQDCLEISQCYQSVVAIPFPRGSAQPNDGTQVSCTAGRFFTMSATREAHISLTTP